jgi:ABC-type phosphate/phosphonate transport system ATPase subunit
MMGYKREQYSEVMARINEPRGKMQVIVGPRQVGKSTLIGQVLEVCNMPYDSYSADDVVGASADWYGRQLVCVWTYVGKGNTYWW